ncbi:MAG: DUF262 domain-containing HNH endonuclease family protein [Nostocales cyanobacterium 94392]|nr:DUF262 domain-containing HNH endonuclease family protein [Nostocales cyanobacterium 94392]
MKASETTFRNLLEGTKQFQIPLFQRPYSWKKENWETLWEDLMSLYNEQIKGFYFLGPIVTQAVPGTAEGISPFVVIDGQQRLTTLTILLAVLRNYLKKSHPEMAEEVYELYLINKFKKNDEMYKVLPTQDDREVYKSIIESKKTKDIAKAGQIYEAYKFFDGKFKKPLPENDNKIDYARFKKIILENLVLVNITSDDSDNPYLIFESLNNKGEELTQADLVRNYIFMQLSTEVREEVYRQEWLPLQESFKANMNNKEYADELTRAFWFYLRKDGESVNEKEVYKKIKKLFDSSEIGTQGELNQLVRFANYYQRLNFVDTEPEQALKRWFQRLKTLDFTTCQIFILNVYHDYEEKRLSLKEFEQILRYLESYFIRRLFVGQSPKILGTLFNELYKNVCKENADDLVNGLREELIKYEDKKEWPNDEAFRNYIITKSIYNPKSSAANQKVKFLLESIEETLTKERVDTQTTTIEHIMPQTLTKDWKEILDANNASIHKEWLHTLGNLTLSGYNSELSNKPFKEKLQHLKSSNLSLNQYFQNIDTWNEEAIKSRAEHLADIAIKIWPR